MAPSPTISKTVLKTIFKNVSENELFVCSLCACMCTTQDKHQLVSTNCGHLFGKNCIRKRLRETGQCPLCSKRLATRRDQQLRTMCLSSVVTIFPIELARIRNERRQLRTKLERLKSRLERAKTNLAKHRQRLQTINRKLVDRQRHRRRCIQ